MGVYWIPVNLTRRQYIEPNHHDYGSKLDNWNFPESTVLLCMEELWPKTDYVVAVSDAGGVELFWREKEEPFLVAVHHWDTIYEDFTEVADLGWRDDGNVEGSFNIFNRPLTIAALRHQMMQVLDGDLLLNDLYDWLLKRTWNMHKDASIEARELVTELEMTFIERSMGELTDEDVLEEFRRLLGIPTNQWSVYTSPQWNITGSSVHDNIVDVTIRNLPPVELNWVGASFECIEGALKKLGRPPLQTDDTIELESYKQDYRLKVNDIEIGLFAWRPNVMHLYHQTCALRYRWYLPWTWKNKSLVPRMKLHHQDVTFSTRTYICSKCGTAIHVDTDWTEGAEVGEKETLA